ncbi:MAG: hypothetical protein J3K34DRAFT_526681 [Monoraphidium minutum]|nr:MAG: hypothetical protein J3K34DRAFT_526681 [Monoraphidium minutum]
MEGAAEPAELQVQDLPSACCSESVSASADGAPGSPRHDRLTGVASAREPADGAAAAAEPASSSFEDDGSGGGGTFDARPQAAPAYHHRTGIREYLARSGLAPRLTAALSDLAAAAAAARGDLAAGAGLDGGGFMPRGWAPFDAQQHLGAALAAAAGGAAGAAAAGGGAAGVAEEGGAAAAAAAGAAGA